MIRASTTAALLALLAAACSNPVPRAGVEVGTAVVDTTGTGPSPAVVEEPETPGDDTVIDPPPEPREWTLAIQPLGEVDGESLETVENIIRDAYGWHVVRLEPQPHPEEAWYEPRKRWRAEIILDWLGPRLPEDADRIMAVTRKDISTTKGDIYDWGICGLAEMGGPASVVSTYRIKKKMGKIGKKERKAKYLQRLRDLSAHEFGHTLGLPHCPNVGCIMEDAKGTVLTFDGSSGRLCDECLEKLALWGYEMPED